MSKLQIDVWDLITKLIDKKVDFVICGGVACFLHGVERATIDLDISIAINFKNLKKIIEISKELNLIPRIPEPIENILDPEKRNEWVQNKGALVYTLIVPNSILQLDIFLEYPKTYEELIINASFMEIKGIKVPVSSIEDLIYAKTKVQPMRDKDLSDVKALKDLLNETGK